ncbi:MAG: PHP domain-containing protein [Kiritimatiellaeota bacterium]|nr:PHP domain-containing protein [Kiritimatiellota bacterium]
MIDLHLHSNCSDGSDAPDALAEKCAAAGLYAAALTDHDTLTGTAVFASACEARGVRAVTGVELSAETALGPLHVLGYGVDPAHEGLNDALRLCRAGRDGRNEVIIRKLRALGADITLEEVAAIAGGEIVARPHIARALLEKGFVKTYYEAFDNYLAKGQPAYADRYRLEPEDAIRLIHDAGGLAVLAHPFDYAGTFDRLDEKLAGLAAHGLDGMEAYYTGYSGELIVDALRLAKRHTLLATGGSDYHGAGKPGVEIGRGNGFLSVPDACFDALAARLAK